HTELEFFYQALDDLQMPYVRSHANYFMVDISGSGQTADDIFERLLRLGVIVRPMASYQYPQHIRVNVGKHEENVRFLEALEQVL
ncbi:MAG: aminotransferase class I/II-fold pyridoxal phosphate-dependent enzyme, partial [Desulfobacterales bacterium]|nr:aminotransferase class I/II-fold pyridoxal phosphate-dependent enzyme [Desulfobacterales bacterium]